MILTILVSSPSAGEGPEGWSLLGRRQPSAADGDPAGKGGGWRGLEGSQDAGPPQELTGFWLHAAPLHRLPARVCAAHRPQGETHRPSFSAFFFARCGLRRDRFYTQNSQVVANNAM